MAEMKRELSEQELEAAAGGAETMASLNRQNSMQNRAKAAQPVTIGSVKASPVNGASTGVPMYCSNCGSTFMVDGSKNHVACPHCGANYTISG